MNEKKDEKNKTEKSWYLCDGNDRDVIISTRLRFARNLANFPFPQKFKGDDDSRVNALILDAFSKLKNAQNYSTLDFSSLAYDSKIILNERGILKNIQNNGDVVNGLNPKTIIMSENGKTCCSINAGDHIHLWTFESGLNFRKAFEELSRIDSSLQDNLQFAADYDFGYLTTAFRDSGSGMKLSARIHIPCIVNAGKFVELMEYLNKNNCIATPGFAQISDKTSSAGCFFHISNNSSIKGSEIDQIAEMESICKYIAELERKMRQDFSISKKTIAKNAVIRAFFIARFSLLISLKEAVDIISDIMQGLNFGFISGIDENELSSLLYEIQNGHITFLLRSSSFNFSKDIEADERLKLDHLRAVIIQEALKNVSIGK